MSHPEAAGPDADSLRSPENKSQEGQLNGVAQGGNYAKPDAGCPEKSAGPQRHP